MVGRRNAREHSTSRFRPRGWITGSGLVTIALLLLAVVGGAPHSLHAQGNPGPGTPGYELSIGDVTVLPGETEVIVPVFITSPEDLEMWQMGLEYDDLLMHLVEVVIIGTESEPLSPVVLTDPGTAPYGGLQVVYGATALFPAGTDRLAAGLRFEIVDPSLIPPGGSLVSTITVTADEPFPILFQPPGAPVMVPGTVPGSVELFDPPLLRVGEAVGDFFDSTLRVPVRFWSNGPGTVLEMGLEYDDLLLCDFDIDGSDLADALGPDVSVDVVLGPDSTTVTITALNGATIPQFSGGLVGHMIVPLTGREPFAGEFPVTLVPAECSLDLAPISNLLDGRIVLENHFVRGDVDFNGAFTIGDATMMLAHVTQGAPVPCRDAVDVNDDEAANIADPIFLLQHLFASGTPPPPPTPMEPGEDPTDGGPGSLGCL